MFTELDLYIICGITSALAIALAFALDNLVRLRGIVRSQTAAAKKAEQFEDQLEVLTGHFLASIQEKVFYKSGIALNREEAQDVILEKGDLL